jgi:tRNA U34 2-thiouridine synthase MnmA/TrmU
VTTSAQKIKAVGLLSGGLDSTLAVKLLVDQGIEVIAYNLRTPFCTCERKGGCGASAVAGRIGVEIVTDFAGDEYIELVKNPRHGRGSAMNPCIDCRIFILRRARELMQNRGAAFCFTGEVLGQRPMSQHRRSLALIEREAGLEGKILRPLSAHLFKPTEAENENLADRSRLLGIRGRSRKKQIALAAELGVTDYPCPAGGCLLTDKNFAARLADAFAHGEDRVSDINLLKLGRQFRLPSGAKAVVGRNEGDNERLLGYLDEDAAAFEVEGVGSPVTLLRPAGREDWPRAAALTLRYSDARDRAEAPTRVRTARGEAETITARAGDAADAENWRVGGGSEAK